MSSNWTRSAVFAASALISLAVVPALANPQEVQSPPAEEVQPGTERVSKPSEQADPRARKLRQKLAPPRVCRSGADSEKEAEEDCAPILQCQPPATVKCQYRSNNQDWICRCK